MQAIVDSNAEPRRLAGASDLCHQCHHQRREVLGISYEFGDHLEAIPKFMRLLQSPTDEMWEQAAWMIGIIALVSADCRNYILSLNTISILILITAIRTSPATKVVRRLASTILALCQSKPPAPLNAVAAAVPLLATLPWALSWWSWRTRPSLLCTTHIPHART